MQFLQLDIKKFKNKIKLKKTFKKNTQKYVTIFCLFSDYKQTI